MQQDPYDVLGVPRAAGQDDIKKAYRRLVKAYHPDRNPGDSRVEQQFKDVSAAYTILGDADKRARYDRGEIGPDGRPAGSASYAAWQRARRSAGADGRRAGARGTIFDDLFGRGGFRSRGADIGYTLTLPFPEAVLGTRRRLRLSDGREVEVQVPAGAEHGQTLRLKGQGTPGMGGGEPGDAYVEIRVEEHPHFRRQGADLSVAVPVTLQEAVLGASIEVPTVDGRVTVQVPAGANTGTRLRLRGKGVPQPDGRRGDQYVELSVVLADAGDPALVEFARRWQPRTTTDPRRKAGLL